jgi:hypothetical protein
MSSTRIKNSPNDYRIQNINKKKADRYVNFRQKLHHKDTKFPEFGINMGAMPSDILSHNHADVDSFLKGTYFNNLEDPRENINVKIRDIDRIAFFERPEVFLPEKLYIDKNRPTIFRR